MFNLAKTLWPRSGADRANSSKVSVEGAINGKIWKKISLETDQEYNNKYRRGGAVVVEDGTLRIAHNGILSACTIEGQLIWKTSLTDYKLSDTTNTITQQNNKEHKEKKRHSYHSLPVALENCYTLITLRNIILIIDDKGKVLEKLHKEDLYLDDSDLAPNITTDGMLILTSVLGDVYVVNDGQLQELGVFGYDIVPPAIFSDNGLAIAGYAGKGFCKVKTKGEIVWRSKLAEADMLPTINSQQFSVVGSLNDGLSAIFYPSGKRVGKFGEPAMFAEYLEGGWVAVSANRVARLELKGKEIWSYPLSIQEHTKVYQPIVDITGKIYFANGNKLTCLSANGMVIFEMAFDDELGSLNMIKPSLLGCIVGNDFLLIH